MFIFFLFSTYENDRKEYNDIKIFRMIKLIQLFDISKTITTNRHHPLIRQDHPQRHPIATKPDFKREGLALKPYPQNL